MKMNLSRTALYALLAVVVFLLWNAWQRDYVPAEPALTSEPIVATHASAQASAPAVAHRTVETPVVTGRPIEVMTDVLHLKIDLQQGNIISAGLLTYPEQVHQLKPYQLLTDDSQHRYVANSALVLQEEGHTVVAEQFHFRTPKMFYHLEPDQQTLVVSLEGENPQGLKVLKKFTFTRQSYLVQVSYQVMNQGAHAWSGRLMTQLERQSPPESSASLLQIGTYTGASYSEPGVHRYQKVAFSDMLKKNLSASATGGWIAMQQHYFLTAWVQDPQQTSSFYTRAANDVYTIGTLSSVIEVPPHQATQVDAQLYVGPEVTKVLEKISPSLGLTVDYGFFWFISDVLFSVMRTIHSVIGNWGWSIIAITVLIKLVFYRLSASSYRSMANMRKIQPKLQALKERYGDDKAKMSQATMELYRQEKINPLGGCLPILVQIPVFIALYWVLIESVELRQAPFILWINDLAAPDAYHLLPIIMGVTMLIQQRLNPTPPDPMQEKMMLFLPVLFVGLFWSFPSGLVLYWIVNNVLSILQQWWMTRQA